MKWPISSFAGIAVIVLYCVFTFSSWALYPTAYNPVANWLSDLGNSTNNPNGAILYNLGCILTGIALFPFFVGFYKWYTEEKHRRTSIVVTQIVGCLAALSLIMIEGFLRRLWLASQFMVPGLLPTQPCSPCRCRNCLVHASTLHKGYCVLRIHRRRDKPHVNLHTQSTSARMVHSLHRPRIR